MLRLTLPAVILLIVAASAHGQTDLEPAAAWDRAADSLSALAFFRSNIASIHERDRAAYLEHYLRSDRLVRAGAAGVEYGFEGLAAGDPNVWPDTLVATHFEVTPLAPGVVYGSYRYRVTAGGSTQRGVSERVFTRQPDGEWAIAVTSAFPAPLNRPVPPVAFVGGSVFDGTGEPPIGDATVVLRNSRIECVGDCEIGEDVHVIDVAGHWIIPGLVDAHVHYSQTGWADGRPDATDVRDLFPYAEVVADLRRNPDRFHRSFLCSGVTSVFDVGGFPWTQDLPAATAEATDAPRVHVSGPLLSAVDHWLNLPDSRQMVYMADEDVTREAVRAIAARGAHAIKVWFVVGEASPDASHQARNLRAAAAEAHAVGLPLVVHATSLWAAKEALRADATLLVHSIEDELVDSEFLELARAAGTYYTPTLTVREGYVELLSREFDAEKVPLDCVHPDIRERALMTNDLPPPAGLDVDLYRAQVALKRRIMLENLARLRDGGMPIATGTDAGNPLTLHGPAIYREMEMMAEAGLSPMEILVATTRNGARAMGGEDFGTIEEGMRADLVVLAADPLEDIRHVRQVHLVVRNGEVWSRDELVFTSASGE